MRHGGTPCREINPIALLSNLTYMWLLLFCAQMLTATRMLLLCLELLIGAADARVVRTELGFGDCDLLLAASACGP